MSEEMRSLACYQLPFTVRPCSGCRKAVRLVHVPIMTIGYFCKACCPACGRKQVGAASRLPIMDAEKSVGAPTDRQPAQAVKS